MPVGQVFTGLCGTADLEIEEGHVTRVEIVGDD
jgi:hypothetical protein